MDEAERCHEIAYIAYGKLLAQGTVQSVIAAAGLTTVTVEVKGEAGQEAGRLARDLARDLSQRAGVDMVAPFGTALHISGRDAAALEAALAPFRSDERLAFGADAPTLEDVFIDLMRRSKDDMR